VGDVVPRRNVPLEFRKGVVDGMEDFSIEGGEEVVTGADEAADEGAEDG